MTIDLSRKNRGVREKYNPDVMFPGMKKQTPRQYTELPRYLYQTVRTHGLCIRPAYHGLSSF